MAYLQQILQIVSIINYQSIRSMNFDDNDYAPAFACAAQRFTLRLDAAIFVFAMISL